MIAGVLLAAGAGTRFGGGKLLHPLPDGTPLGVAALRNLTAVLNEVIAVVRPGDRALERLLAHEGIKVVQCRDAIHGMGHSLAAGVAAEQDAHGWVIALGDMPRIRPDTIRAVANALEQGAAAVVPVWAGQRGHPIGFGRRFRNELLSLTGDVGARSILAAHTSVLRRLEVDDPGILQDLDTRADAQQLARSPRI